MIAWDYYGLKGWTYLWGEGRINETVFKAIFCGFIVLGASVKADLKAYRAGQAGPRAF